MFTRVLVRELAGLHDSPRERRHVRRHALTLALLLTVSCSSSTSEPDAKLDASTGTGGAAGQSGAGGGSGAGGNATSGAGGSGAGAGGNGAGGNGAGGNGAGGNGAGGSDAGGSGDGCSGAVVTPPGTGPCDPVAPVLGAYAIPAGDVLGAGRAADGTIYVLTKGARLFVSKPPCPLLIEQVVSGSGTTSDFVVVTTKDAGGQDVTVEVAKDASGTKMGVAHGPIGGKTFPIGSVGEVLVLLDPATAVASPAQTATTFRVVLSAAIPDGRDIVFLVPDHASGYGGARLFVGPPGAVAERKVTMVNQTLGIPSQWSVKTEIDGVAATITWSEATGTMTIGTQASPLTIAANGAIPAGAMFVCF